MTILTGFLGAGKTTLLNRLIEQPGFGATAVIVNEFGEAGVDGALVTAAEEGGVTMSVGCLCCTISGDIRLTLLRILNEAEHGIGPSFDRVVIETTGLADPLPLLQTFMTSDSVLENFVLNGVVTLVDTVNGPETIARFREAQRQVSVADLLLVTKTELARDPASRRDLEALKTDLARRNPSARVHEVGEATPGMVFSLAAFDPAGKPPDVREWLRFNKPSPAHDHHHHHDHHHGHDHHHHHDLNSHGDTASAFCLTSKDPISLNALGTAIAALQASFGADLLRLKGIVDIEDHPGQPHVLHVVGHLCSDPRMLDGWPEGIDATRIVLIVSGPGRDVAPQMLKSFLPGIRPFSSAQLQRALVPA